MQVTRQQQLLSILEGVPLSLSGLNLDQYNVDAIYFLSLLNDENHIEIMSNLSPNHINTGIDYALKGLFLNKTLTSDEYRELIVKHASVIIKLPREKKEIVDCIFRDYKAAYFKYALIQKGGYHVYSKSI